MASYRATFPAERWQTYLGIHSRRYRALVALVAELGSMLPADGGERRILDVGPRFEIDLFHRLLPNVRVDTLGLNEGLFPPAEGESNFLFDLNDADDPVRRPALDRYSLIVMAEVLEHLRLPPAAVLPWLSSLLVPGGYLLIQTPNAASLPNRLRMLIGINPFQALSADRSYPGHYREYTAAELRREGDHAGLEVVRVAGANYFDSVKPLNRLYRRLEPLTPTTLRAGLTVVYRAPRSGA